MSIPNHSILPVSSSELPIIAQFVQSSKLPLTINRLLFKDWPNEAAQALVYTSSVESSFKDPSTELLKVVDDKSGDIVAHLVLTRKNPSDTEVHSEKEEVEQNSPEGFEPELLAMVMKAVTEVNKEVEGIDHLGEDISSYLTELTHIFVKPSYRKQGIGSQLVRVGFEKAEAEGLPLILCSEPNAYEFYLKLGFRDTRHFDIDLSKYAPKYSGFGVFRLSGMIWSH